VFTWGVSVGGSEKILTGILGVVFWFSISACGGDGGGGGGEASPTQGTTISGSVQAPSGQIAFNHSLRFLTQLVDLFHPSAYASITGTSPVPDGTLVQLARLSADTSSFTILATTPTSGGTYFFNLTSLQLQIANDLIVRVATGAVQMRAFVTGSTVDLDPASETAVRLVVQQLTAVPGATIHNFTVQELADITGSINVLVTVKQLAAGTNVESAVTTIRNAIAGNAGLMTFIAAAGTAGQTPQGPGDVGNHVPLTEGNVWQFQGSVSSTLNPLGLFPQSYQNKRTISGTKTIGNVATHVSSESNPDNGGRTMDEYLVKDTTGLMNWGDNDVHDTITAQLVPYRQLRFPLQPGTMFEMFSKQGVDFGGDLDGDGIHETLDISAQVKVLGFETVGVPAGTFSHAVRVETTVKTVGKFSQSGSTAESIETETIWLASGVGPVKRIDVSGFSGFSTTIIEELVGSLVDGSGIGGALNEVSTLSLTTNDLVYDKVSGRIYASIPGTPGSITIIDPVTGTIGASVVVGNQPNKLAISDDGQFLYVGLDGESAVRRITLSSFTADLKFPLGPGTNPSPAACGILSAEDLGVLPGNSHSVAVSIRNANCTPSHETVAIYDDGVRRPTSTPGPIAGSINIIQFSQTASTLYGYDAETLPVPDRRFSTLAVTPLGVSIVNQATTPVAISLDDIVFDNGLIYTNHGYVVNPTTWTTQGQFMGLPNPFMIVRPDSTVGRVFFTGGLVGGGKLSLYSYDINSLQLRGQADDVTVVSPQALTNFIRWGTNGLAFRGSGGQVFIVRTSLVP